MEQKLGIHDTCGVLNLHGMPGIIGAVVSMIAAAAATGNLYHIQGCLHVKVLILYYLDCVRYNPEQLNFTFPDRYERTAARQAQIQLAFLVITLAMAIITGFLSGKIISGCTFPKRFFLDSESWETPSREVPYFFGIVKPPTPFFVLLLLLLFDASRYSWRS